MKLVDKINFGSGKIIRDKFIDLEKSICDQEMELTENMFQIEFEDYILDLGWSDEIDCSGNFKVFLVKDQNWEEPIKFFEPKTIDNLLVSINKCLDEIPPRSFQSSMG